MRVLVFGASLDKRAGIESFLMNMNKHMDGNCAFDYVCLENQTNRINDLDFCRGNGAVIELPLYNKKPIGYLHSLMKLFKNGKNKYQSVYVNLFSMVHIMPALLGRLYGYKVVLHSHNNSIPPRSKLYMFLHRFNRWLTSRMKFVRLTTSDGSTEFMFGKKHLSDAILIYNAIDIKRFGYNEESGKKVRTELGVGDRPMVGFVGRLAPQKNPVFLIEIFNEIHKLNAKACLVMVGEGELLDDVKNKIAKYKLNDDVLILPNRTDIEKIYNAMNLFILPSLFEGLGIVLIEAQCTGLPCLTSADVVPKIAQVSDELLKYVPLSESPEVWAQKAEKLLKTDFNRSKGCECVREAGFDINKEALRLEKILIESQKG